MALAAWVGKQTKELISGEVKDCDDLPSEGLLRVVEPVGPTGRKKWEPPEWFKVLLEHAHFEAPLALHRRGTRHVRSGVVARGQP
eukprot:6480019-Amphidinium_carterae.1